MTENSSSEKLSSWNFDDLHNEDESNSSNDFFSVLKKNVNKHVYFDEQITKNSSNEHSTTIRLDNSDLISRCKHFLPLITDANRTLFSKIESGENVRIELDSDEDDERRIEMNLMFCPNVDSSSEQESDEETKPTLLQITKKKTPINIVEIQSTNILPDDKEIVKN